MTCFCFLKATFHTMLGGLRCRILSFHVATIFLPFESFPSYVNDKKLFVDQHPMPSQVFFSFGNHLHPIMLANQRLRKVSASLSVLCLPSQKQHIWSVETILCMVLLIKHYRLKLPQQIHELQPQFPLKNSNEVKHLANAAFLAGKSTFLSIDDKGSQFPSFKLTKYVN